MSEFRMPSLGADMDAGTIVEWLVAPGDPVRRGRVVAVVDTAKAAMEIESFEDGVVEELLVGIGVRVPVGTPLAVFGPPVGADLAGGSAPPAEVLRSESAPVPAAAPDPAPAPSAALPTGPPARPRAAPPVRRLAHQLGVDLDSVQGTGPGGRITHDDLLHAAPRPGGPPRPVGHPHAGAARPTPDSGQDRGTPASAYLAQTGRELPGPAADPEGAQRPRPRVSPRARRLAALRGVDLGQVAGSGASGAVLGEDVERAAQAPATSGPAPAGPAQTGPAQTGPAQTGPAQTQDRKAAMRTAIANLMSRSNTDIPHYYVTQTVDLAAALAWLRTHNADLPPRQRVLPAALFLRATVLGARAVPDLNGHWIEGELRPADQVDLGVAIATRGRGLVTPAIPDAGDLRIDALMARLGDLVGRVRRGALKQAEMSGPSITVSSLGETAADALFGVIFPPQVALVGIGGIVERPWAVGGMLTVRPVATVALAADHRASDGRTASAFLAALDHALQNPEEL